jgi:acetate kinase
MLNAIVVLNAGSSSIKFSLFVERGATLESAANAEGRQRISTRGSRVEV